MASSSDSCGVCDLRHITKQSIVWCTDCDEGLCKDCQEHHSLSKASRNHNTIGIEEYQKLPSDVLRITQYCRTHQEKFIIYCRKHESPCCRKCIVESHKECRNIKNLEDVIKHFKTSSAVYEIEETLVEVAENLQNIRKHQQENLSTLKEQRKQIEKEIQNTRTTINKHLDKLQENLIKQLYAVEAKENSKIRQLLSQLEKKEKEISDNQRNIANTKQHATDFQLFLLIKQIEDVSSKDDIRNSLVKDKNLMNHSLEYKINTAIQNIISDIKSFGDIHIEEHPHEIVLSRMKTKQAQIHVPPVQSRSITNIKLQRHLTIVQIGDETYGCCMIPDGRIVLTYKYQCKIQILKIKGSKDFEMKMPFEPFDIVYISEDNTLAVTSGDSDTPSIAIIDLERQEIKRTIPMKYYNFGITIKETKLIYCSKNRGIRMMNLQGKTITDIVRYKLPSDCYTATFDDNIYHSNWETDAVACYDLQGELKWTFENKSVLKSPHGIDVDNDGYVYVVGYSSNNVVVIAPDGQRHRELLTAIDGPVALHISKPNKQLLIATWDNDAFLYDFI